MSQLTLSIYLFIYTYYFLKVSRYNAANRQVAILCNHQKTVSKSAETMFENLGEKLAILKRQKAQLNE